MLNSKDYKAIQDLQARYDTYVQGRRFDLIVDELYAQSNEISFYHSSISESIEGRDKVEQIYKTIADAFEKNGGFLCSDLCSGQVITFSEDGKEAEGSWLTIGVKYEGAYYGNSGDCPFYKVYGRRITNFILKDDQWRIKKTSWTEMYKLGPFPYSLEKCTGWAGQRERRWELPPHEDNEEWMGDRAK